MSQSCLVEYPTDIKSPWKPSHFLFHHHHVRLLSCVQLEEYTLQISFSLIRSAYCRYNLTLPIAITITGYLLTKWTPLPQLASRLPCPRRAVWNPLAVSVLCTNEQTPKPQKTQTSASTRIEIITRTISFKCKFPIIPGNELDKS